MRRKLTDVTVQELREFFGAIRWRKFSESVDSDQPRWVQGMVLGARKAIVDFCREVYRKQRGYYEDLVS